MKKRVKALALTLALLTTTACGSNQAKVAEPTEVAKAEINEVKNIKETKQAHIETPKADSVKVEEKDDRNYLIPQTVELNQAEEEAVIESKEAANKTEERNEVVEIVETIEAPEEAEATEAPEEKEEKPAEVANAKNEIVEITNENPKNRAELEESVAVLEQADALEDNQRVVELEEKEEKEEIKPNLETIAVEEKEEIKPNLEAIAVEEKEEITPNFDTIEVAEEEKAEVVVAAPEVEAKAIEEKAEIKEASNGLTITSPSIEEVREYWTNYQTKANDTINFFGIELMNPESNEAFDSLANLDVNNLNLGQLSNIAAEDALHIANTARLSAGIRNELVNGSQQANYAQAAALVNRLNLEISHNPVLPAGLNEESNEYQQAVAGAMRANVASGLNLMDSVLSYLKDDLGSMNQAEVGHRRWVLNPQANLVGLGQVEDYNAMFVNNDDYNGENQDAVYAYPGETAISEFHSEATSLSLMFGENFDITNAQVEVEDLATGEVNNEFNIDESFKGCSKAITFGYGMNFAPGTKLQVRVNGVTKDGENYPVEYTITYNSLMK